MQKIIIIIIALLGFSSAFSQGIEFEQGTLKEAYAKAKKENKMVFVDCYTVWCGPCKKLSKEVFPQKKVGDYYNDRFVSIKLDCEKGEGIEFAKKYEVKNYPTLFYMNANGEVMYRVSGAPDADGLIADAKIAVDPSAQLPALEKRYADGERDLGFLFKYCEELGKAQKIDEIYKIGEAYTKSIKVEELYDPKVFKMVTWSTKLSFEDEAYQFMFNNWDKILEKTGVHPQSFERMMSGPAYFYVEETAKEGSIEEVDKAIEEVKKAIQIEGDLKEKLYALTYLSNGQVDDWYATQKKRIDNFKAEPNYDSMCFVMYQMAKDIDQSDVFEGTKMCKKLIKEFVKLEKEHGEDFSMYGYQSIVLLYKTEGNKKKSLEYLDKYMEIAKKTFTRKMPKFVTDFKEEIEKM